MPTYKAAGIKRLTGSDGDLKTVAPWIWVCKGCGFDNDAFARWHITSTDIALEPFPLLKRTNRSKLAHAISFHGFDVRARRVMGNEMPRLSRPSTRRVRGSWRSVRG